MSIFSNSSKSFKTYEKQEVNYNRNHTAKHIILRNNTANNRVLSFEFLLPVIENADFFLRETFEGRSDIFLVLGHLCQSSAGILAGEHGVSAAGAVERNACCDVEDAALHSHIDGLGWVGAIVGDQLLRCKLHSLQLSGELITVSLEMENSATFFYLQSKEKSQKILDLHVAGTIRSLGDLNLKP